MTIWGDITPEEGYPENKDYPHILFFTTDKKSVIQGDSINLLFRVKDEGINFPLSPSAIEVCDISHRSFFQSKNVGWGYYLTQIHIPENATIGYHKIEFKLTDNDKNTFTQSIKILVEKK